MVVQLIRRVRAKQPEVSKVDWSSGATLVSTDRITQTRGGKTYFDGNSRLIGPSGVGITSPSGAAVPGLTAGMLNIDGSKPVTVLMLFDEPPDATSRGGAFGVGDLSGSYDNAICFYHENSDRPAYKAHVGGLSTSIHGYGDLPINSQKIVWGMRRNGGTLELWRNGKFDRARSGTAGNIPASAPVYIGSVRIDSVAYKWSATPLYLVVVFDRYLSDAEMRKYSANLWQIFEPETIPLFYSTVTAQFSRPSADVSTGTWTASSGSDLYAMLDETAASDADYITTSGTSTCEVALTSLSDPASSTGHIVRYRISATAGGITVRLRQGTTTIATWTHASAPTSLTTYEQTLTGGEADSISDYSALRLQFEATT